MSLQVMYNDVAEAYETANRFGSLSESHKCAIEQIKRARIEIKPRCKVLDFGVGDGAFLKQLKRQLPFAEFTGIDISKERLACATEALPLTTIEGSATDASGFLPHHSQDLVLAHFINAYIPINKLFDQAKLLTRANGYFSMVTTTYDSFPHAQQQLAHFIAEESILSSIVGHYYKALVKNTTTAANQEGLLQAFSHHHFQVVEHQRLHIPMQLNNIDELARFAMEGTWFLNTLTIRMLPKNFLIQRLKRLFSKIFTFPYQDTHVIDVILAKK